ncbi:uncharacterized protein LOC107421144 isoform X3 [Ziziphus jujuba]|uniref:Uncharacterized protein LOC107421144 isoform X3 n=1 Tax=Ziziphus jujuba TaxID=326968 RepID=A0ABM4A9R0_ZIZJJ|nr:uncharacterized protein LOC107421144 isoform X3 [Ziziphus jujuba]
MENSWQGKCGSTLQSSTPSLTSSSSQELRNQAATNTGYYFYPHGQQDLRTAVHGRVQDPSLPNNSLISSHRLGNVIPGNSFLSLLSGPPSLLQCDFQEFSNPKPLCSSVKLMSDNSSVLANATGSRIPLTFNGLQSENLSGQNLHGAGFCPTNLHGAGFCPTISSRPMTSSNCSSKSVLPDVKSSELDKAVVHCMVPGNEKVKGSFSLSGEWRSTCHANVQKACGTRVQTFQVKSMEANSNQSASYMSGCPRVFCLSTGGYLLLSNTGLLGIVCSCHCFHMSVLKFCEHSGLFGVNPGDAVCVDGGETIAQWRKVYFQKFGIRVPEDQSDWDWPEGLSTTAGLLRSRATTSNISSNISHLVHSSEGLVRSGQTLDNSGLSKNLHTDQNLVIDALQNKQKRNVQDNSNILLKGLIGTSLSNVRAVVDNQIMECPVSQCLTMSKFVGIGSQDGSQSISGYIDSILKNGNSSISYPASQELKTICKESDLSMINAQRSLFVGRDAALSNIELKLGQPYQSSQQFENSNLTALGPQLLDTLVNPPPKSVFPEQIMHNNDLREKVELGQNLYFATGPSGPSTKREQNQLNLGNCAFEVGNSTDAGRLEKLRGNLVHNSVVSLPTPTHSKIPSESSMRTKANDNMLIGMEHVMPNTQYSGSFSWHNENGLERQLPIPELCLRGLTDKGKGVGSIGDKYYFMKDTASRTHKEMDITGNDPHIPVQCGNSCYSHQLSSLAVEVPDTRKICNYPENVPFHGSGGQVDHVNHRSLAVSMGSGLISPSQVVSTGIPLATSTCLLDQTSALSREEGIGVSGHLLDDNLRLLALRQMLDLSKQQNAYNYLGMKKGEGKYDGLSYAQNSCSEPSVPGEQWQGSGLTSKMDVSEAAVKARLSGTSRFGGDKGMNNCCDLSTMTQGISLHPKEMAVQCQLSNDHLRKEQPSMRSDKDIAGSSEHEKSCCRIPSDCFQRNCNCSVHTNHFERNFESRIGNFPNVLKEQIGMVNSEASVILGSKFAKNHNFANDKMISLEQSGLNGKLHKNIFSHSSQWRDVPSKAKGVFDVMHVDCSSDVIDGKGCNGSQHRDTSSKCLNDTMQAMDSLKENEISNISSGCSAPAVTQVSVEVNNTDSYSADVANSGCVSDLVIDEGSGIDECWSSDDACGSERSAEFLGATCKTSLKEPGSSKNIYHQSSRSLLDELKLINSLTWKKGRNQIQTGIASQNKDNLSKRFERRLKAGKRKRDCPYENSKYTCNAESPSCSSKYNQIISSSSQGKTHRASFSQQSSRRKLSSARKLPRKRDIYKLYNEREENDVSCGELYVAADTNDIYELSGGKKFKMDYTCAVTKARMRDVTDEGIGVMKYNSVGWMKASSLQVNICQMKPRPMVCGKYGELSDGKQDGVVSKSAKIVPLSKVLKSAKRCTLPQNQKPRPTFVKELKKTGHDGTDVYCDEFHYLNNEIESCSYKIKNYDGVNNDASERMNEGCSAGDYKFAEELPMLEKEKHDKSKKDCHKVDTIACQSKIKSKEVRKRSIYELTVNDKNPSSKRFSLLRTSKCFPKMKAGKVLRKDEDKMLGFHGVVDQKSPQVRRCSSLLNSDAFCCVCGSSKKDEFNYLLECSQCSIKVHQACYGVSRVPKGHWYCRPCRTNSKDIACVLCGYGGGAMTRALQSRAIAKTFLRAWNIETECRPKTILSSVKTLQNELSGLHSSVSGNEEGSSFCIQPENIEPLASAACKMEMLYHLDVEQNSPLVSKLKVHNSITVGLLDSTTKQWVHMVCALWTPGTRCPNVDTMSAFDVSGASRPKTDVVCSICCRPGGSCIQCRVINCSIQFHPWCAHQKGLLQSEVEGVDSESVGFYGRCMLHAIHPMCETNCDPAGIETGCSGIEEFTCARTEGYKGRKHDGFCHKYGQSKGKSGCLVPQEQLNAWIHINGQKTCAQGLPKLPASDVEHDCRKEYARYKQVKGWKHLVVYKSGIHALGLYTSRFISRGEMVVEYVGEIVGQRVADKRENEYQSGRKLQYKSACYFFRIDKEHIIDATHKGGIARFVNHSCLPNCVAKVISVRNEKKVVFFAERDIFPGEEVTYDYHFNHEDEVAIYLEICHSKVIRVHSLLYPRGL